MEPDNVGRITCLQAYQEVIVDQLWCHQRQDKNTFILIIPDIRRNLSSSKNTRVFRKSATMQVTARQHPPLKPDNSLYLFQS